MDSATRVGLPEALRNRILRRLDWRFLAGMPHPSRVIRFCDGSLADALPAIAGSIVDGRQTGGERGCDLAVVQDPDGPTLKAAWRALRDGGACYVEWTGRLPAGPAAARRRLSAAGFHSVRCYGPRPDPRVGPAALWLPLDDPGALDHFASTLPPPRSLARRLTRLARRLQLRLAPMLHVERPLCAVAWKAAPPACWGPGATPEDATCLLVTPGERTVGKAVAITFVRGDARPRAAVKMPRIPESIPRLRHEATILEGLQARPALPPGIPRLLAWEERPDTALLVESFVGGTPHAWVLDREPHRDVALRGARWLAALARGTAGTTGEDARAAVIEPALERFEAEFGRVVDAATLGHIRALLATIPPLVPVCEQRDFGPWNLRVGPHGELGVLDWESATLRGLPYLDLVYFLSYLGFAVEGARDVASRRACYRRSLDPGHPAGAVTAEAVACYASSLGLAPAGLPALRALTWIVHASSEHAHLRADAAGLPPADALRGSLFFGLLQEEMRRPP